MGGSFIISAICLVQKTYLAAFIFMLLFLVAWNIGNGSVVWVYTAEVAIDKAAGFAASG